MTVKAYAGTHLVIDINGYYDPNGTLDYTSVTPCRIVDTRQPGAGGAFTASEGRDLTVAGVTSFDDQGGTPAGCAIPANATAVEATITAVGPAGAGFARAWPAGTPLPNATFLNFTTGESIGNTGTIPLTTTATTADMAVQVFARRHPHRHRPRRLPRTGPRAHRDPRHRRRQQPHLRHHLRRR